MPYSQNIPQATDQLSQSQGDLLGNFQALYVFLNINHVDFASGDQGKHKYVEFPVQLASPPAVFPATEIALYSFLDPVTGVNQLYLNNSAGNQIPIDEAGLAFNGYSYLPSGLIMKWAQVTVNPTLAPFNPCVVTFLTPFPTACLNVQITPANAAGIDRQFFASVVALLPTQFTVWASQRTTTLAQITTFYYLAIGY